MFFVTFYSYKGGVGRTLALVNTAVRLASRGKKVFILDFDLEAPGVDAFDWFRDENPRPGIVEYIGSFADDGKVDPLDQYVSEVNSSKTAPGKIFFMGAGRKDENYQFLLSRLDWKHFYKQQDGFLFVENLKSTIGRKYAPDYVLVDSRTGLTDISGICTLQLPDLVVLIFNLNNQNVQGVSKIYRSIQKNKLGKMIKTLQVASPIPDVPDFVGVRRERLENAREKIGAEVDVILPFDAFVAFEETILNGGTSKTYLSESYEKLSSAIVKANPLDILTMVEEAKRFMEQGNLEAAENKFQELIDTNPESYQASLEYGRFLRTRGKDKEALEYFERARHLNPADPELLGQLVRLYLSLDRHEEALRHLDEFLVSSKDSESMESIATAMELGDEPGAAIKVYDRMLQLWDEPDSPMNLANLYMQVGKPELAIPLYKRVMVKEETSLPAVYNYAYALSLLRDPSAAEHFKRAVVLFERNDIRRQSPAQAANWYQAVSNAYAGLADFDRAQNALNEALESAKKLSPNRLVFSSVLYKQIPAKQFIEETLHLLKRIEEKLH
jgi:tetratricopeptide (TPR) repeat protein